jgi:hypothetical protein
MQGSSSSNEVCLPLPNALLNASPLRLCIAACYAVETACICTCNHASVPATTACGCSTIARSPFCTRNLHSPEFCLFVNRSRQYLVLSCPAYAPYAFLMSTRLLVRRFELQGHVNTKDHRYKGRSRCISA